MKIENRRDFDKFLLGLKSDLPALILIQSKEPFEGKVLLDQLVLSMEGKLGKDNIELSRIKVISTICNELQSYFFSFGKKKIYLCEDIDNLNQTQKAPLEEYLDNLNPSHTVILTSTSLTATSVIYKKSLKNGVLVEIPVASNARSKEASTREWIASYITKYGKKIQPDALALLSKEYSNDRFLLQNEIDKLLIFTEGRDEITKDDFKILSPHSEKGAMWKLSSAIMEGNIQIALSELNILYSEDVHPLQILRYLRSRFRFFLEGSSLMDGGAKGAQVKEALQTGKGQIFDRDIELMRKKGVSFFRNALFTIDQREIDLKNSQKDPNLVLEMFLVSLT